MGTSGKSVGFMWKKTDTLLAVEMNRNCSLRFDQKMFLRSKLTCLGLTSFFSLDFRSRFFFWLFPKWSSTHPTNVGPFRRGKLYDATPPCRRHGGVAAHAMAKAMSITVRESFETRVGGVQKYDNPKDSFALRIQICPTKGITPDYIPILRMGLEPSFLF